MLCRPDVGMRAAGQSARLQRQLWHTAGSMIAAESNEANRAGLIAWPIDSQAPGPSGSAGPLDLPAHLPARNSTAR